MSSLLKRANLVGRRSHKCGLTLGKKNVSWKGDQKGARLVRRRASPSDGGIIEELGTAASKGRGRGWGIKHEGRMCRGSETATHRAWLEQGG